MGKTGNFWFLRGGSHLAGTNGGMFDFDNNNAGGGNNNGSFRLVMMTMI
ncbi:MAG TPA: hypothetical protein IAB45_06405 [Candidatus Onthousia faecavium]|nr:hypothetical protein [Candidatus Onthousia faecavium]